MKAIVTVIGKDEIGILGKVSSACANVHANILEVTQSVLQDVFAMIMLIEIDSSKVMLSEVQKELEEAGNSMGMKVHVMHEDIFNSMHKI